MSDQGPFGQPPVAPPPAAPPQPPTPPQPPVAPQSPATSGPQPPPPAYAPPPGMPPAYSPQSPPPPGKKRKIWLIVVIAVAVLLCLPAACLGTFAASAAREKAKTSEAVGQAETHFAAATEALGNASESMGQYGEEGDTDASEMALKQVRTARDEIAAARAAIEPLDDSQGKTDYLASLDAATEALEGVENLVGTLRVLAHLSDQVKEGTASIRGADGLLDAAIDAGNDGKYATMKSKASAASARYATASAIFNAAHKSEPTAGLDTVVAYVKLRKQQADLAVSMASYGKAGRTAAYNEQVDKQKSLDARAKKTGEPEIVKNPDWFDERVATQQTDFEAAGTRADELRAKALKEFGYTAE